MRVKVIQGTYVGAPLNRTVSEGEVLDVPAELGNQLRGMGRVVVHVEPPKAKAVPEPEPEVKEEPETAKPEAKGKKK